jgi:hypothetical protein
MKKLFLSLFLGLYMSVHLEAQVIPNAKAKYANIDWYQVIVDKQGKPSPKLSSTELANSDVSIGTSEDGRYTFFTIYSSMFGGEETMTVKTATIKIENGTAIYTAKCKSIMHSTESTWLFYFDDGILTAVADFFPGNKLWIIKFR